MILQTQRAPAAQQNYVVTAEKVHRGWDSDIEMYIMGKFECVFG
jgi:hypothetical protein